MNLETVKIALRIQGQIEIVDVKIDFSDRKNLQNYKWWEDGEWHFAQKWDRIDGKVDNYKEVLMEAYHNGFND